jgi:glycosyltransferase involved in cell wall biosynthesis
MRVAVFPSDDGGCGWYRLRWPAATLADQGYDITVDPPQLGYYRGIGEPSRLYLDADTAVVQRITSALGVDFVATHKDHGHRVIVDVDDDLDALHPHHPYLADVDGRVEGQHRRHLHDCCQLADAVTVTTPALAERYGYGKAIVLPNLAPAGYLKVRHVRSKRVAEPLLVGWTGRPISHIGDARLLAGIAPVLEKHGARFAAWGDSAARTFVEAGIPKRLQRRIPYRELRKGYPQQVAKLDVGLVPLVDSAFNRAKSWLKGMEYAALGVPFVASRLPEYERLAALGAGVLAGPGEWPAAVDALLTSAKSRRDLAVRGREAAAALTYEAHAHRWWDAWSGTSTDGGSPSTMVSEAVGAAAAPAPA